MSRKDLASEDYDIVIIGGGLSGLALAIALSSLSCRVAIVDAKPFHAINNDTKIADEDLRAIALSYVSQQIFTNLGLWDELKQFAYPIQHVHVSDRGHYGFSRIHAKDYQIPNVGSVVPMQHLLAVLSQKIKADKTIDVIDSAELLETSIEPEQRILTLKLMNKTRQIKCKLAIAADGTHSKLRDLLNLQTKSTDYQQSAIVTNIGVERLHDGTAYERFTATGPLAMLPISDKAFSLVWTVQPENVESLLNLSDKAFLQQLQTDFGYRLGRFSWVSRRQSFPLSLLEAENLTAERAVVIGNAAHTLHPIAGQGFNLGLRDIAVLADVIKNALQKQKDIGGTQALQEYDSARQQDMCATINLTDKLVKVFSNNYWPHSLVRNLALLGLDTSSLLKNKLAYKTMGFIKTMPTLAIEN